MGFYAIQHERGAIITEVKGRNEWALKELLRKGPQGCTPIDNPAPRWSAYVFNLKRYGLDVETITETHGGPFPGNHARYVLRSVVMEVDTLDDV